MAGAAEPGDSIQERLRQIEAIRAELHQQAGGRYDPATVSRLLNLSQALDRLVVEVTRHLTGQVAQEEESTTASRPQKHERGRPQ